jgi:protein-S-isoprenylcysteine O-methyltransferase Ste14
MSAPDSRPPTNYRAHRRATDRQLTIAVVLFLLFVGSGLITIIYQPVAGVVAFGCLLFGVGILGFLWILLALIGRWVEED